MIKDVIKKLMFVLDLGFEKKIQSVKVLTSP